MGGCCCCTSRRYELDRSHRTPVYIYCPQALEEREPLSSTRVTTFAVSPELLVDTNLETSGLDTYQAPPAPLPYDVGPGGSQNLSGSLGNNSKKGGSMPPVKSEPPGETVSGSGFDAPGTGEGSKESDCKNKLDSGHGSPQVMTKDEPSKLSEPANSTMEEEDVCPICLEEYDVENPRIITKCEHHFHLSCILEWMERSDTCPMCDQMMIFDYTFNE